MMNAAPPLSWSMRSFDGFLWCFLTLTVSTYLKYDSMTYLLSNGGKNVVVIHIEMNQQKKTYPTNKRKTNAMVSSKDKKTINANHQTSQWRPPYSVGSPSGGHDVRRQRSRFSDPPPLKVPEATDSANIWCKFWIPHLSLFTRSYILDYKHLGSYVYTQNKQNTYIIYTCIYIYIYHISLSPSPSRRSIYIHIM